MLSDNYQRILYVIFLFLLLSPLMPVSARPPASLELPAAAPVKTPAPEREGVYRFVCDLKGEGSMESGISLVWNSDLLLYRGTSYLAERTGLYASWYSRPLLLPILALAFPAPGPLLHEYYGHGAVLREFGFNDISYSWSWFSVPSKNGKAVSQRVQTQGTYEENQLWLGGGIAASQLYLLEAEKDMYRSGRATLLMTLPVQASLNDRAELIKGLDQHDLFAGNDGATWLRNFRDRHGGSLSLTGKYADRSRQALTAAGMDPVLPWLAFVWLHYLWTGKDSYNAPMLPLGGLKFAFSPKADLTPLGPENYYYVFIAGEGKLASVYYREGSSPEGGVRGYGAEFGPINFPGLALTPGYDRWILPERKNAGFKYSGSGFNVQLKADLPLYKIVGLTAKAAYKTGGYMLGLPSHSGFYGYGGASIAF